MAKKFGLAGFVRNTGAGVEIMAQGGKRAISGFKDKLQKSGFDASFIFKNIKADKYADFQILKSIETEITSEVPADLAVCEECKKELFDKKDKRFGYPFINCVNCGPRFSIIKKLPYDRKNTTMLKFKMCPSCASEYDDPSNRRFHAQPNACPECGPKLYLCDKNGRRLSERDAALKDAVKHLKNGKIIALKSIGGYHLACDALNGKTVAALRKRKDRPSKPFAVMASGLDTAGKFCLVSKFEKEALLSAASPIVLLRKKSNKKYEKLFKSLAPANPSLGVMLPYTPLQHLLSAELPLLVMTSGNRSDEPVCINEKEAFSALKGTADYFLANDRDIENRSDDSIVKFLPDSSEKITIRRSRGYVPAPVNFGKAGESIFAAGGDLKNNFCITRNAKAYISQFIGDLAHEQNLSFFAESIKKTEKFLDVKPQKAVCDAHPAYFSSQYVKSKYKAPVQVYHHYAHAASVIAEHGIKDRALGFIFDGNGYGDDGRIWGGEVILFDGSGFSRIAHFDYFALPGGDICVKEIWRVAVSLLQKHNLLHRLPEHIKKYPYKTAAKMVESGINSPLTSSAGRLFDAVAALTGVKSEASFEAEAAVALEAAAVRTERGIYEFSDNNGVITLSGIIESVLNDIESGVSAGKISARFHNTLAEIIIRLALKYSKQYDAKAVLLSGGVFQNTFLLEKALADLRLKGSKAYFNSEVPINDGGLCLGQAYIKRQSEE
ncbi:MAG: carbamoyltransferase HypF [Endomicrobia bacterium]|nr:carbamoyltransferase HypF [Endomicrobiia bacterium]